MQGSLVVVDRFSCPVAWNLPRSEIKPVSPALADGFFTWTTREVLYLLYVKLKAHINLQLIQNTFVFLSLYNRIFLSYF